MVPSCAVRARCSLPAWPVFVCFSDEESSEEEDDDETSSDETDDDDSRGGEHRQPIC